MSEMCSCCFCEKEQRGFTLGDGDLCIKCANVFGNAEVVEWDGCVLRELGGSEYFGGVEDLIQEFVYKDDTPLDELVLPRYMHPCDIEHIVERVSAHILASNICDYLMDKIGVEVDHGMYWPEFNEESLTTHLGAWLRSQDIFFFKEDTSKIVDLKEFWEQVIADEKEAEND